MVQPPPATEPRDEAAMRRDKALRTPLATVLRIRRGIWRDVEAAKNTVDPILSTWPKTREHLEKKTLTPLDQWPAELKQVGRPLKNRPWKKANRRLRLRRIFNQLNWRILNIRFQIAFMWIAHILKLTALVLLWIGVPTLLLYGAWLLITYLWGLLFGGPISSSGGM